MTRDDARRQLETIARPREVKLEVGPTLSSDEKRAVAGAAYMSAMNEIAACNNRIAEIIAAHAELQQLYAKRRALTPKAETLNWERWYFKFKALKASGGIGWEYMGTGDTWEEVVRKATERATRDKRADTPEGR